MARERPTTLPEPVAGLLAPNLGRLSLEARELPGETQRRVELNRMKRVATSLLGVAFAIFVAASFLEERYVWAGFVRATAEAAMVGALADWFAVTALFRHPLGLKIPHTNIVARRKDQIAFSFGEFVKANFLSPEVIGGRLRSLNVARRAATWLSQPGNSEAVTGSVMIGISAVVEVMKDEDVQQLIEQSVAARARKVQLAPLAGNLLDVVISGQRQQELLNGILKLAAALLEENRPAIERKIGQELPWWLPHHSLTPAIYQKIVKALERTLSEANANPEHPLHGQFEALVDRFVADLKHSPEVLAREEALKEELLEHQVVREFSLALWSGWKRSLQRYRQGGPSSLREPIRQGLARLAEATLEDAALQDKLNRWVEDGALFLTTGYGYEVEQLIAQTIQRWDAQATSDKIELQIGRDLQFIRINGTVVGGLAGLVIYTFSYFFL